MTAPYYPTLKIILGFALLGGLLGDLCAALFLGLPDGEFLEALSFLFFPSLYFGTPPALLTGLWLAWWRVHRNGQGLLHAAVAGAVFSAIAALFLSAWLSRGTEVWRLPVISFMTPIGAISALLLAFGLLPKPNAIPPKNHTELVSDVIE